MEMPSSLGILQLHFQDVGFANVVKEEHIKFLVVKCVETMAREACKDGDDANLGAWNEPCRPCQIIDIFWRAHMSSPRKYLFDCYTLMLGLGRNKPEFLPIDRHGGGGRGAHDDYVAKKDALFEFEKQFPRRNDFCGRLGDFFADSIDVDALLFTESFDINKNAKDIAQDEPVWALHDNNYGYNYD